MSMQLSAYNYLDVHGKRYHPSTRPSALPSNLAPGMNWSQFVTKKLEEAMLTHSVVVANTRLVIAATRPQTSPGQGTRSFHGPAAPETKGARRHMPSSFGTSTRIHLNVPRSMPRC